MNSESILGGPAVNKEVLEEISLENSMIRFSDCGPDDHWSPTNEELKFTIKEESIEKKKEKALIKARHREFTPSDATPSISTRSNSDTPLEHGATGQACGSEEAEDSEASWITMEKSTGKKNENALIKTGHGEDTPSDVAPSISTGCPPHSSFQHGATGQDLSQELEFKGLLKESQESFEESQECFDKTEQELVEEERNDAQRQLSQEKSARGWQETNLNKLRKEEEAAASKMIQNLMCTKISDEALLKTEKLKHELFNDNPLSLREKLMYKDGYEKGKSESQATHKENLDRLREDPSASIINQKDLQMGDVKLEVYKLKDSLQESQATVERCRELCILENLNRTIELQLPSENAKLHYEIQKNEKMCTAIGFTASPIIEPFHVENLNPEVTFNRSHFLTENLGYSTEKTASTKSRMEGYFLKADERYLNEKYLLGEICNQKEEVAAIKLKREKMKDKQKENVQKQSDFTLEFYDIIHQFTKISDEAVLKAEKLKHELFNDNPLSFREKLMCKDGYEKGKSEIKDLPLKVVVSKYEQLESKNQNHQEVLLSIKNEQKKYDKLKNRIRELKEELIDQKHQVEMYKVEPSQLEQYKHDLKEQTRQKIFEYLKQINLFLQSQAPQEENLDQLRVDHSASIVNQKDLQMRDLKLDVFKLKNSLQESQATIERCKELCILEKMNRTIELQLPSENAKLHYEIQKNEKMCTAIGFTASPIMEPFHVENLNPEVTFNRSHFLTENLGYSTEKTASTKSRTEGYFLKMQEEFHKNVTKGLNETKAELESSSVMSSPLLSLEESSNLEALASRATWEYTEVLKKRFMI